MFHLTVVCTTGMIIFTSSVVLLQAVLPDGELGEVIITTLVKESPLIRYRTGLSVSFLETALWKQIPRLDTIMGHYRRYSEIKGVSVFPAQIEKS